MKSISIDHEYNTLVCNVFDNKIVLNYFDTDANTIYENSIMDNIPIEYDYYNNFSEFTDIITKALSIMGEKKAIAINHDLSLSISKNTNDDNRVLHIKIRKKSKVDNYSVYLRPLVLTIYLKRA